MIESGKEALLVFGLVSESEMLMATGLEWDDSASLCSLVPFAF